MFKKKKLEKIAVSVFRCLVMCHKQIHVNDEPKQTKAIERHF